MGRGRDVFCVCFSHTQEELNTKTGLMANTVPRYGLMGFWVNLTNLLLQKRELYNVSFDVTKAFENSYKT